MDKILIEKMSKELVWLPESEIGFFPVTNPHYDQRYFHEMEKNAKRKMSGSLNRFRANLVNDYLKPEEVLLDIGVGCGVLFKYRPNSLGYDINPSAIEMLKKNGLFFDPYLNGMKNIKGISFFDSLEHIENPGEFFCRLSDQFVFVSIPLFKNLSHVLNSKHFKKDEHYWYFTWTSFVKFMDGHGLGLLYCTRDETKLGREDIWSFVFRKRE